MSRVYWVCVFSDLWPTPWRIQQACKTAEEALKVGRQWQVNGDVHSIAIWLHDPSMGAGISWCCYREMKAGGRWKNPRRGWVERSPLALCACGSPVSEGRYCRPCLDRETANVSGEEMQAAEAVLDRPQRPSVTIVCDECGPLPHGPSCHQGERQ